MTYKIGTLLLAATVGATLCSAQLVHIQGQHADNDPYTKLYSTAHIVTFAGKVTGIQSIHGNGGSRQVTILVRNHDGGGTAVVDVGPQWFVDNQIAKIKMKSEVQITGSKIFVDGRGMILASQVLIGGQGGPVLALRRPNGTPYWTGVEVAKSAIPTGGNVVSGTFKTFTRYDIDNVPYWAGVVQTNNGLTTIDLGPQWYFGQQNLNYQVGDYVSVVTGPNPIQVGPGVTVLPSYAVYNNSNVYTIRNVDGTPAYYWGRR